MLSCLYVAGRVLRSGSGGDGAELTRFLYEFLKTSTQQLNARVFLPLAEPHLEIASSRDLFDTMVSRIDQSDKVITLFTPLDASGPIESTIAALKGKPQLVVCSKPSSVPRMMHGLPGVVDVIGTRDRAALTGHLVNFLRG